MREQLRIYIDHLFADTVQTQAAKDFHDELLQNTLDRFDEERAAGKTEQDAYRTAVLSLGNTEELLKPFYPKREGSSVRRTVAIILYATSLVPVILFGAIKGIPGTLGVTGMFVMWAVATMLMIMSGRAKPTAAAEQSRTIRAIGVALLIASVTPIFLGSAYDSVRLVRLVPVDGAVLGVCGMFGMIAAGIALLVTAGQKDRSRTVPKVPVSEDPYRKQRSGNADSGESTDAASEQPMRSVIPRGLQITGGILTAIYWVVTVCIYFSVSFSTGAWYFSWLVFVFASGIFNILSGIVRLCCGMRGAMMIVEGVFNLAAGVVFYWLTASTGMWIVTWLVFPISACIRGIVGGIYQLVRSTGKESE